MTTSDALAFFTSNAKLAQALGIKPPSVCEWKEYPPALRQLQIERITKGKLKADPSCYPPKFVML